MYNDSHLCTLVQKAYLEYTDTPQLSLKQEYTNNIKHKETTTSYAPSSTG
jgi:hypothetical protein